MSRELPANLLSLHSGEEFLRTKSIEAIQACDDLSRHAAFIERCMNTIDILCRAYDTKDATELIVQHLGARMFNATASALKLLLSGYYQASALLQRDMLETIFLLDYFTTDAALIQRWHALPPRERWKEFKPAVVRTALDDRDGFTKRRRQEAYDLLTELAGHPTPQGFVMLRPKGMEAHLGPFVDPTTLHAVLSELAKNASQAAGHINQLCAADALALFPAKIGFMEAQHDWMQHFFGGDSVTRRHIDEAKQLYAQWLAATGRS
jgi:hypothetical protein